MTLAVGVILILVFLAFAALMFLERLSALLALPLMALVFTLVAVGADLLAPESVRELRVRTRGGAAGGKVIESVEDASRFERWSRFRLLAAECLAARTEQLRRAASELTARFDDPEVSNRALAARVAALRQEAADESQRTAEAMSRAARTATPDNDRAGSPPEFFSKPPLHAGPRAAFEERYRAVPLEMYLQRLARELSSPDEAAGRQQARATLDEMRAAAERLPLTRADEIDPHAPAWRAWAAATYVGESLLYLCRAGSLTLYATILATIFGGMFAVYVRNLKVAERLVYWTAEFAGERPAIITLAVFLVTAGIFTSVGGLGTVIMIGTIILPILRSIGLSPVVASGVFLIAISMGGTLQPVARRLWMDVFGIPATQLDGLLWTMVGLYMVCGVGWIAWGTRRGLLSSFHAEERRGGGVDESRIRGVEGRSDGGAEERRGEGAEGGGRMPARLMIAPLVPVALVYFGGVEEISAFLASIAYMYLCVARRPGAVRVLARSMIEGAQTVMPPVLLMVGIGMLFTAVSMPAVQAYLLPLLSLAAPQTRWAYVAVFALGAPLALYRGPLNVWGMGLAISAMLLATTDLPPAAILGAILAAGMLQGVCDPTNTANVWVAGFQAISVNQILRYTIVPVWLAAAIAVAYFGLRFVGG
ncbi:MAG: hypothetical protein IPM13_07645 [Phycisphaerales bacterium]|nr:hypothetical protein [Phycisphaerales bacterium]